MTTGFSITNIAADDLEVKLETTESKLTHTVSGCMCDEFTHVCKTPEENYQLVQNMIYSLCLSATSSNVEVKAVNSLTIVQAGEEKFFPISDQAPNSLTKVDYVNGSAIVTTRSISSFYSVVPPPEIKAVGEVELSFVLAGVEEATDRRLERKLQSDGGSFEVDVKLGMGADGYSGVERVFGLFVLLLSPIAFIFVDVL